MGYAGKKNFRRASSLALAGLEHKPTVLALRSAELFMRASLAWFLIFCKTLLEIFAEGGALLGAMG
jgi:hypothetical protein